MDVSQVGFGWSEDEGVLRLWASSKFFMTESRSKLCGRCPSRREQPRRSSLNRFTLAKSSVALWYGGRARLV
ncbi:hypothetical protein ACFX13_028706 [Malus domestica]